MLLTQTKFIKYKKIISVLCNGSMLPVYNRNTE